VALAFAVAASANLPCILLTLYWKRCNTGGIMAGMIVGTVSAIALVMVSPNMTYPLKVKANATQLITDAASKRLGLEDTLAAVSPEERAYKDATKALEKLLKDVEKAEADLLRYADQRTSIVGLEEPLILLKNPGIISIPLGFLAVILGSLLWGRDRRSESRWTELYVRQNTGLGAAKASVHG
jgi:cation/acetate symporter